MLGKDWAEGAGWLLLLKGLPEAGLGAGAAGATGAREISGCARSGRGASGTGSVGSERGRMGSGVGRDGSGVLARKERFFRRGFPIPDESRLSSSGAAGVVEWVGGREFSGMALRNKLLTGQFKT